MDRTVDNHLPGLAPPVGLRSEEVCAAAGVSYRKLDYWTRSGVITPAVAVGRGTGSRRAWSVEQVKVLRLLAVLSDLGAERPVLTRVAEEVALMESVHGSSVWFSTMLVAPDGSLRKPLAGRSNGWLVHLSECRRAEDDLALVSLGVSA